MNTSNEKRTPQNRTYTVDDIASILGVGRTTAYKLANSGLFKTVRVGNMIRISRKSFEDWLGMEPPEDEIEWSNAGKKYELEKQKSQTTRGWWFGISAFPVPHSIVSGNQTKYCFRAGEHCVENRVDYHAVFSI